MSCVNVASAIDFSCIRNIIADIRNNNISITTGRMILKQIDNGAALFGFPSLPDVTIQSTEDLCTKLESLIPVDNENVAQAGFLEIIAILMQIWKLIQPVL